mmetsp:Transcript_100216/g.312248  ORF Transcript_100216/g.312248 Transcript_100216/m.312248 type:complete len:100 (-) Transcript_100216:79-378(-)
MPANLLHILGRGGRRLLSLAWENSRAALRAGAEGDRRTSAAMEGGELKAMAAGTVAAGAVAGMAGWDRTQLGLWLAQTGMDGYQYQMNMWKLVGTGMPY